MSRRAFYELDGAHRMQLREQIEQTGAHVDGYSGQFVRVALPNPGYPALVEMEAAGFHLHMNEISYFPLGSDKPPTRLRHHGPYIGRQGEPGMWAYVFLWHDSQEQQEVAP